MVERIDFYILPTAEPIGFTCRLLEKAFKEKHRVYVQTPSRAEAEKLNASLWTFKDISFIPHRLHYETAQPAAPITIGDMDGNPAAADMLVVLAAQPPENYQDYQRVAIVVPNDEKQKAQARKFYKNLNTEKLDVQVHNL